MKSLSRVINDEIIRYVCVLLLAIAAPLLWARFGWLPANALLLAGYLLLDWWDRKFPALPLRTKSFGLEEPENPNWVAWAPYLVIHIFIWLWIGLYFPAHVAYAVYTLTRQRLELRRLRSRRELLRERVADSIRALPESGFRTHATPTDLKPETLRSFVAHSPDTEYAGLVEEYLEIEERLAPKARR